MPALDDVLSQAQANYAQTYSQPVQQQAVDAVNAAGARTATPGVGAPGSNAQTDQTNLNLAAAMDRGDQFNGGGSPIQPSFAPQVSDADNMNQALEARRQALAEGIANNTNPDKPAIFVTPKGHDEMVHEYSALSEIAHRNAMENAQRTHQNFLQNQNIESANDFSGLVNDLSKIPYQKGTPEYDQAAQQVLFAHPQGSLTQAGKVVWRDIHDSHVASAKILAQNNNAQNQEYRQAYHEASQVGKKFGVDVQFDSEGNPSVEETQKYGTANGSPIATQSHPAVALAKQAAAVAEAQSKKDAAYRENQKADMTPFDKVLDTERAKLDAMRSVLSPTPAPTATPAASATPAPSATPFNYTTQNDFKTGYDAAPRGATLYYNGKPYKKP